MANRRSGEPELQQSRPDPGFSLMLLHELAHNIYDKDGKLLIDDDYFEDDKARSAQLSDQNTKLILDKCESEIRGVKD